MTKDAEHLFEYLFAIYMSFDKVFKSLFICLSHLFLIIKL